MYKKLLYLLAIFAISVVQAQDLPVTEWKNLAETDWYSETESSFEISTAETLAGLSLLVSEGTTFEGKTIELIANIDLDGNLWTPIGPDIDNSFMGTFNGNDHVISNLIVNQPDEDFAGLFGSVLNASFHNIHLDGTTIYGKFTVGSLVANLSSHSLMENCTVINGYVQCQLGWGGGAAGGVIGGLLSGSAVKKTSFSGEVHGGDQIGGLVGTAWDTTLIEECFSEGLVSGGNIVGGLVGFTTMNFPPNPDSRNILKNSYSRANVIATGINAGGLYGSPETNAGIENCYSTGTVQGQQPFGGSIGKIMYDTFVSNTYWNTESSCLEIGIGEYTPEPDISVTGRTTAEMKTEEFVAMLNNNENIWSIDPDKNDGYPILFSQPLSTTTFDAVGVDFVIFPTLTLDHLNLETSLTGSYAVLDMMGKVLLKNDFDKNTRIDVSNLQSGHYLITVQENGKTYTKRFIKR